MSPFNFSTMLIFFSSFIVIIICLVLVVVDKDGFVAVGEFNVGYVIMTVCGESNLKILEVAAFLADLRMEYYLE